MEKKKKEPGVTSNETTQKRRTVGTTEGFYAIGTQTCFGDILEEDMPIQLWTGIPDYTDNEMRLPQHHNHWKDALVAAIRQQQSHGMVLDVAYLFDDDDDDEQLKKSMALRHVRLLLGNPHESRSQESLPEA